MINSEFENIDLYKILSEKRYYKNNSSFIEQILQEKETNKEIKRTLTFKNITCTPSQLENIKRRSILPKFGQAIYDKNITKDQDEVWMEYNPELLKSEQSQKYLTKLLLVNNNEEKIKVFEKSENVLKDTLNKLNKYNIFNNNNIMNYNKDINDVKDVKDVKDITVTKKIYKPSFLRNMNKNIEKPATTNNNKYNINKHQQGIRISNLPSDIDDNDIKNWLNMFKLQCYKFYCPKDKYKNNRNKSFAFLTFNNKKNATLALDVLNGSKFDYNIITAEFSKY